MADLYIDLTTGTWTLLILKTLVLGPEHGWPVSERSQQISSEVLHLRQGSLYPALHRLGAAWFDQARWNVGEQSPGEILRAYAEKPQTPRDRNQ